jgi:hypothetical protein
MCLPQLQQLINKQNLRTGICFSTASTQVDSAQAEAAPNRATLRRTGFMPIIAQKKNSSPS